MNLPEIAHRLRRGTMALALAGTLALCVACGGGGGTGETETTDSGTPPAVSGEVQVTEEEVALEPEVPEATATPERRQPQVRSVGRVRDPFINPLEASVVPVQPAGPVTQPGVAAPAGGAAPMTGAPLAGFQKPKAPEMPTPDVMVTGLVRSGATYRAILTGPEGSLIVAAGQKVGSFQVASISPKGVVLSWKGQKVTLPLEREEFGPDGLRRGERP